MGKSRVFPATGNEKLVNKLHCNRLVEYHPSYGPTVPFVTLIVSIPLAIPTGFRVGGSNTGVVKHALVLCAEIFIE